MQYLQSRPDDSAARSSLQFFFSALDALKNKNPMTESFLVQLDVDIEGTAFRDIRRPTGETPLERVRPHTTVSMDNVKLELQISPCIRFLVL